MSKDNILEEDENYNPMERDFNDVQFNSYKSGPGSFISPHLHTQKRWEEGGKTYKLHVSNIPLGIKDTGFQNVFANFGSPLETYLTLAKSGKCKYGFVKYRTLREAERAIYCVNKVPPLNLSVKFALTDEAKENRALFRDATPASNLDDLPQYKATSDRRVNAGGRGRGLPLPALQGIKPASVPSTYTWYSPYLPTHSEPLDSHPLGEFSVYIGDEIIELYNEALTFERPVIKNNEKYIVCMGRGYALKAVIDYSERYTSEQKNYVLAEDPPAKYESQPCCICREEAMRICFNCSRWYCSKICFRADSPNHLIDISRLVICYNLLHGGQSAKDVSKENSLKSNKNVNSTRGIFVKKLIFPPLNEECKNLIVKSTSNSTEHIQQNKQANVTGNRNSSSNQTHFIRCMDEFEKGSKSSNQNLVSKSQSIRKSLSGTGVSFSLPDDCPLDTACYTQVKITHQIGNFTYWINKVSDSNDIFDITKKLYKYCSSQKAKPIQPILPSSKCAVLYNKFWYRAEVLSCCDQEVKVRLIDNGREEICNFHNLRTLPNDMLDSPPLAFKVRFASGTPSKYENLTDDDEVGIKPVSMDTDGYLIVSSESSISSTKENIDLSNTEVDGPLPFNIYSEVIIAYCSGKCEFWVNLISQWNDLKDMTSILNMIGDRSEPITTPVLEEIYIKLFDSYWCRAKVTCLNPLTVFYIDYGNEEQISKTNELRVLPSMLTHRFPPMAVKINLAEGTNEMYWFLKASEHLQIKPVSKDEECYTVVVEGEDYSETESNSSLDRSSVSQSLYESSESFKHLLFSLENCSRFEITVNQFMSKDRFCGSLNIPSRNATLKTVEDELSNLSTHISDNFKLGDAVACLTRDGICARGYVMSIINDTRRVALVDYAYVDVADKLSTLPPSLTDLPEAGVSCTISQPHLDVQVGSKLRCSRAQLKGNKIYCESEGCGKITVSVWSPRLEDGGISSVVIPSGSSVLISSYKTPQAIYIQSLEPKQRELFETLIQDVAAYSISAPPLNREPEIGEVVTCLFPEDQNFYRAQVCRRRGKLFTVTYIDFGNTFDVSPQDMRILDDDLKMVPCCCVKIGLKEIKENILNGDCLYFLNMKCSKENEPLYLEHDDDLSHSILKSKEGETLNNRINDMINSNWMKCLEEGVDPTNGMVFFGDDVKYIQWDVGSKTKLMIVGEVSDNSYFVINCQDGLLDFIRDWFTPRVSEYCSSFAKHYSYTPRLREICFVKLLDDNQWYRAVVTNAFDISCWVVFLDFGNTGEVYFKNVRPMTDEFIRVPSILKKCIIEGLPSECKDETAKKRLNEILVAGCVQDAVITKESKNGVVHAYFKTVADVAQDIGLPPIKPPKS